MADSPFIESDFDGGSDGDGLVTGDVIWWVPDRPTGWSIGDASVDGVPYKKRSVRPHPEGTGYQAVLEYEGLVDGIDPPEDEARQWSIQITERMDPIETHPEFAKLKSDYGGTVENGKVKWPETIPSGTTSGSFGSSSKTATVANPMLNTTHYPVLLGNASYTRVARSLPSNLLSIPGQVVTSLPSSSGMTTPDGYVWIRALPQSTGYGNAFRLTDTYKLTKSESWVYLIYKIIGR